MEMRFCHSCGMPTAGPGGAASRGVYCVNCTEADGRLKSRDEVRQGIADWLAGFSPDVTPKLCAQRADRYLSAMPAWAE